MRQAWRFLLAFGAGALWAFCFGREPLLVAPWVALAPLFLLWSGPRPGWLGWCHGLGFWVVGISWIPATLRTFGGLPWWLAGGALLLLGAYLALYHALFAALAARWWESESWMLWAAIPGFWVVLEVARAHVASGFPWNLAAYSAAGLPGALESTAWVGSYGLSGAVVLVNVAVARSISRRSWKPAAWVVLGLLVVTAVAGRVAEEHDGENGTRSVALLQPNIPNQTEWTSVQAEVDYSRVFDMSRSACRPDVLLVWPESAAWPYSYRPGSRLFRDVQALVDRGGCTVLLNSPVKETIDGEERYLNAAFLARGRSEAAAGDSGARYDKQHLVPFGEYVPLGRWLPFLESIARAAGDFVPGPRAGNLEWAGEALGAAICFEVTFPGEVATKVAGGASILVTVTNDAWYGDTWAPWQHLRAAQFRAAENRRPLLRAAITGVSAVIDPSGRLVETLGVDEQGILRASVAGGSGRTLYNRAPAAIPTLAFLLAGFAILRSFSGRKRP